MLNLDAWKQNKIIIIKQKKSNVYNRASLVVGIRTRDNKDTLKKGPGNSTRFPYNKKLLPCAKSIYTETPGYLDFHTWAILVTEADTGFRSPDFEILVKTAIFVKNF